MGGEGQGEVGAGASATLGQVIEALIPTSPGLSAQAERGVGATLCEAVLNESFGDPVHAAGLRPTTRCSGLAMNSSPCSRALAVAWRQVAIS